MSTHEILSFYLFVPIADPHLEVKKHQTYLKNRDMRTRIYFSYEGVNAQISASNEEALQYRKWLLSDPRFAHVEFKIDFYNEHVLPRQTVKFRNQLVALDVPADLAQRGEYLSPNAWKKKLAERTADTLILDVRNNYEWKIGHFEGATLPSFESFRQFPAFAKQLKKEKDPKKTEIMMYCTGGIRCELFSSLIKQEGFEKVFQLHGGVVNYSKQEGNSFWRGKLFVFDDRLAITIGNEPYKETISTCQLCNTPSDAYYNCANMDCNELFIYCPSCAEKTFGCCSKSCQESTRRRPFDTSQRPKPFKKWYHYSV